MGYFPFKALIGGMEQEERGQMFLLEHFLMVSPSKVKYSMVPLASYFYLMSVLGSLQDKSKKAFSSFRSRTHFKMWL